MPKKCDSKTVNLSLLPVFKMTNNKNLLNSDVFNDYFLV